MSSMPYIDYSHEYMDTPPEKNRLAGLLKIVIIVLGVVLFAELLYYFVFSGRSMVEEIHVSAPSDFPLSKREIVVLSGFAGAVPLHKVDTKAMETNLRTHSSVYSATVRTQFPNRLYIQIVTRNPVAAIIAGDSQSVFGIDEEGRLFATTLVPEGFPVLSGVRSSGIKPGDKLQDSLLPVVRELSLLRKKYPVIYGLVSEIRVQRIGEKEFEGWIYFSHSRVKVRTNLRFGGEQIENIMLMIDLVEKQGIASGIDELDFRSGSVVLKMRGE